MTPGTGPATGVDVPFTVDADLELDGAIQPWLRRRGADVRIRRGAVPARLRHVEQETPVWQRAGGQVLVRYPWDMHFLVEGGASITYEADAAAELDLRLFLLSTPWLALALQRGLLPLHASAVMDGAAVHAFAGPPGEGKSTLAAALSVRGYMFFTDDTLLLDPARIDGGMRCYGYKDLKLWPHGAVLTRLPPGGRVRTSKGYDKHYAEPPRRSPHPVGCLKALYRLGQCTAQQAGVVPGVEPIRGRKALETLYRSVHRLALAKAILGPERLSEWLATLVRRIGVHMFRRPMADAHFDEHVGKIAGALSSGSSGQA